MHGQFFTWIYAFKFIGYMSQIGIATFNYLNSHALFN